MADTAQQTGRRLGLTQWVQFGYIIGVVAVAYVMSHVIKLVWTQFAEPDELLSQLAAVLVGVIAAVVCYRHPKIRPLANEVAEELVNKVTWPTRAETKAATIVVIITSIVAAAILGLMDFFWSWMTDLIYVAG